MKMSTIQKNGYSVDLTKRAGYYDGTTTFRGLASCGGSPTTSTLTFRVEVANAASVKGRWRAIAITGTFTQRESPQLGCVSSGANFDIFGKLVQ
jgi:hypothetical protein